MLTANVRATKVNSEVHETFKTPSVLHPKSRSERLVVLASLDANALVCTRTHLCDVITAPFYSLIGRRQPDVR